MRSRSRTPPRRENEASAPPPPRAPRRYSPWLLPVVAALFVLAAQPFHFHERVLLFDPPTTAVLAPDDAWTPPIARLVGRDSWGEWPSWLYTLAAAGLLGLVAARVRDGSGMLSAALFLVATGLGVQPLDVIPTAWLVLTLALVLGPSMTSRAQVAWGLLAVCVVLAIGTTIEFGLLLIPIAAAVLTTGLANATRQELPASRTRAKGVLIAVVSLLLLSAGIAAEFAPALLQAALRPWTGIWMQPPAEVLSTSSVLLQSNRDWLSASLLLLWFGWWWVDRLRTGATTPAVLLAALPLSLVGITCSRYAVICAAAIAILPRPSDAKPRVTSGRLEGMILAGLCAIGGVSLLIGPHPFPGMRFSPLPRLVDPTQFGSSGTVILTYLNHAPQWQTAQLRQQFPLFVDNRWDLFGEDYRDYARLCRDLTQLRDSSYVLSDGRWGGYRRQIDEFSPTLLVVDSRDIRALRQLSLSPDWSLQSIDGQRTIFGSRKDPSNLRQQQRAGAMLTELEWPRSRSITLDPAVIIANDISDDRRVAEVLSAIRLPYAAMRMLPADERPQTKRSRAWCLLELAHRVHRHSGVSSLLDQSRAVAAIRAGLAADQLTESEQHSLCRSLQELGVQTHRIELLACGDAAVDVAAAKSNEPATDEDHLRDALLNGDSQSARQLVENLAPAIRSYYEILAAADSLPTVELLEALTAAVQQPDFPDRLRGEAWFYVGCLGIEAGQPERAAEALDQSRLADPESPFNQIRQFYFRQLTRP